MSTLPLDRRKAIDKMLSPDWQKKKRGKRIEVPCVDCGKPHEVERTRPRPRCAACARKVSGFNGGSRQP